MNRISFESRDVGEIDFYFVKSIAVLLRHFMLGHLYSTYILTPDINRTPLYHSLLGSVKQVSEPVP